MGKFLRACAIDELPQLWNIFIGDMSFVGPRPLPINEIQFSASDTDVPDNEIRGFKERLSIRPGLTGIAQIFADRDTTRARKFRYDLLYVRRYNFCLDLRLIALSFYISFLGKWEDRGDKLK